ncbi:hypothetical protein C5167_032008 [Papaver somniferum]|uniref:Uncharacterized protein n=1 Tax=Papaver somniferum TaxID=3469 RepID=A0A4Y7K9F4_PAPSO|nr:hypothetical protein C5167_032008 [Papaver somniferum]
MEVKGRMDLQLMLLVVLLKSLSSVMHIQQQHPEIHLFVARFRERRGDIQEARAANIKHANMEHRLQPYSQSVASAAAAPVPLSAGAPAAYYGGSLENDEQN